MQSHFWLHATQGGARRDKIRCAALQSCCLVKRVYVCVCVHVCGCMYCYTCVHIFECAYQCMQLHAHAHIACTRACPNRIGHTTQSRVFHYACRQINTQTPGHPETQLHSHTDTQAPRHQRTRVCVCVRAYSFPRAHSPSPARLRRSRAVRSPRFSITRISLLDRLSSFRSG